MASKMTIASHLALFFVLMGMGAHILGFVTDFWCAGSRDEGLTKDIVTAGDETDNMTDSDVIHVHTGLFREKIEFENGILSEEDSSLSLLEEQILVLAIAGTNTLLCLVLYIRAIHIFVGVSSFIIMSLMLLSAFYTFEHTKENVDKLQEYHSDWPTIKLSWSFICVLTGLLVNIVSTATFLTALLIKGEKKAASSSKGLGPSDEVDTDDKTPMVSIISGDQAYENAAYSNENKKYSNIETVNPDNAHTSNPTTDPIYTVKDIDIDIVVADDSNRSNSKDHMPKSNQNNSEYLQLYNQDRRADEPYTDLDAPELDNNDLDKATVNEDKIETIAESCYM